MQAAFRGRKQYPTQNELGAVDFDLKFTYILTGWEGSAHDATILADALEREDGLRVAQGNELNWLYNSIHKLIKNRTNTYLYLF
jgi:hypothetical protein